MPAFLAQQEGHVTAPVREGARRTVALMYHDVVDGLGGATSGFGGKHAEVYKLTRNDFALHLEAVRRACNAGQVMLTFDDGGASAYTDIAPMLEQLGWRGYFFVTTGCIAQPGFLTADQIRELDRRGHYVGSHSNSHPRRMSRLSWEQLVYEWNVSVRCLEDIVRHPVTAASVPGGEYSRRVAQAAIQAGIQNLFTSEPTTRPHDVSGCRVFGRYSIQRGMGPEWSGAFVSGQWAPRFRQALLWKTKRAAKALAGGTYFRLQEFVFSADRDR